MSLERGPSFCLVLMSESSLPLSLPCPCPLSKCPGSGYLLPCGRRRQINIAALVLPTSFFLSLILALIPPLPSFLHLHFTMLKTFKGKPRLLFTPLTYLFNPQLPNKQKHLLFFSLPRQTNLRVQVTKLSRPPPRFRLVRTASHSRPLRPLPPPTVSQNRPSRTKNRRTLRSPLRISPCMMSKPHRLPPKNRGRRWTAVMEFAMESSVFSKP